MCIIALPLGWLCFPWAFYLVGVGEADAARDGTQAADNATRSVHHGAVHAVVLIVGRELCGEGLLHAMLATGLLGDGVGVVGGVGGGGGGEGGHDDVV